MSQTETNSYTRLRQAILNWQAQADLYEPRRSFSMLAREVGCSVSTIRHILRAKPCEAELFGRICCFIGVSADELFRGCKETGK